MAGEPHQQVVDVFATVTPDPSDLKRWLAQTINRNNPRLAGLFAYGRDFGEARANLAQVVFVALGDGDYSRPSAVIIFATTVKTFRAAPTIVEAASAAAADV